MNGDEYACKVENGGENGAESNLAVGDVHVLCHKEGGSAHNGGHYLTTGGGGSFDCACKFALVAGLFHHGDGDRAGGDGVAHGGAGHHTAESGGDDSHLGRTAGEAANQGVGEADEEGGDAGTLKEGTEDDEHHYVLGADLYGSGHDAGGGVEESVEHSLESYSHSAVGGEGDKGICDKSASHTENGDTHTAAAKLNKAENADYTYDNLQGAYSGGAGENSDKRVVAEAVIKETACAQSHENKVIPGNIVVAHMMLAGGIGQITHDDDQSEKRGHALFQRGNAEKGGIYAVKRETDHYGTHNDGGSTFPDTGLRLLVVLAHKVIYIFGGAYVNGVTFKLRLKLLNYVRIGLFGHSQCPFRYFVGEICGGLCSF